MHRKEQGENRVNFFFTAEKCKGKPKIWNHINVTA
jgi:hypothetical protein